MLYLFAIGVEWNESIISEGMAAACSLGVDPLAAGVSRDDESAFLDDVKVG